MLRVFIFLVLLVAPAHAAEPLFPAGSRIGLVPPADFIAEENFRGFLNHKHDASIIMIELPVGAYAELNKTMTVAALKKQGIVQEKRETLALAAGKGFLVVGRQQAEKTKFRKWIMVAATSDLTALVTVQLPESAKTAYPDAAIRAALASLASRPSVPIEEQLELLPFKFDDLAGFRPIRTAGAAALLTYGPNDDIDAVEQPRMIVSVTPGGPGNPASRETFARNFFGGIAGFKDVRIVGSEMLRLGGGQQVHEVMAEAKNAKSGQDVKIVQWIRFGGGAFLHIVGVSPIAAWNEAYPRFRGVRDNITPKG